MSGFLRQNKAADALVVASMMVTCDVRGTYNMRAIKDLMESEANSKIPVEFFFKSALSTFFFFFPTELLLTSKEDT